MFGGGAPERNLYHKQDLAICSDRSDLDPLFIENVNDICDTLAQVMSICGINGNKGAEARPFIAQAFQYYDAERHQFLVQPKYADSIRRSYTVQTLHRLSHMTYLEAMLAYDIIKRAIKAFFHHTPEHSLRSPITEAILLRKQQFAWQHAAIKTIRIFESYENLFFASAVDYSDQILEVYDQLYQRIKKRTHPAIVEDYYPRGCKTKVIIGSRSPVPLTEEPPACISDCNAGKELRNYLQTLPAKELTIKPCNDVSGLCSLVCQHQQPRKSGKKKKTIKKDQKKEKPKNVELHLPRCHQCNCPKIICNCNIDPKTGIVALDCSQGPYQCQWIRMDKPEKLDVFISKPEYHQCPIDCLDEESSSDSECNYCHCPVYSSDEEDNESNYSFILCQRSDNDEDLEAAMKKDLPNNTKYENDCISNDLRKINKVTSFIAENQRIRQKFKQNGVRY